MLPATPTFRTSTLLKRSVLIMPNYICGENCTGAHKNVMIVSNSYNRSWVKDFAHFMKIQACLLRLKFCYLIWEKVMDMFPLRATYSGDKWVCSSCKYTHSGHLTIELDVKEEMWVRLHRKPTCEGIQIISRVYNWSREFSHVMHGNRGIALYS